MVRNAPDPDDDDFMPPKAEVVGAANRNAKKKAACNRGSHERLTGLYEDFNDAQKEAAKEMGMQALMNIQCTNLHNPMCDWLARLYHPDKREFVIPRRGRIPLDEESVFNTLGVPNGGMDVPYKVDTKVQASLFPEMFPGHTALPANSAFANMLGAMETSDDNFKRKLLMYLISNVFALTTSTPQQHMLPCFGPDRECCQHELVQVHSWFPSHFTIKLNVQQRLTTAFDEHNVDYNFFGGPENFSKWMDGHTNTSCPLSARSNVENLVGQFASNMTNLLGNLVRGWTAMSAGDREEVANQFHSFVRGDTSRPTGSRGRYDYNESQEVPPSDEDLSVEDSDYDDNVQQDGTSKGGDNRRDNNEHHTSSEHNCGGTKTSTGQGLGGHSGTEASKMDRDAQDADLQADSKRTKLDPVAARKREATVGGRVTIEKIAQQPSRPSARACKAHTATRSSPR